MPLESLEAKPRLTVPILVLILLEATRVLSLFPKSPFRSSSRLTLSGICAHLVPGQAPVSPEANSVVGLQICCPACAGVRKADARARMCLPASGGPLQMGDRAWAWLLPMG